MSLNPLLVTCIMLPKWCGQEELSYAVWLTCCAAFGGGITPFVSIENIISIFYGGTRFLEDWHAVSFWLFPGLLPEADVEVSSDAAANFG